MLPTPDPDSTTILLIRHGATDANLQRPYILQGRSLNGTLSQTGIQQAQAAAQFLEPFPIHSFIASPMKRAQETAEIIAESHGHRVKSHDQIIEVDVGDWEGRSWNWIEDDDPEYYESFMSNSGTVPYKGGESYSDVRNRVVPAMQEIAQNHLGQMIAIIAHNVVNRSLLADCLGVDINEAKNIKQQNACVNVLKWNQETLTVVTLNSVFHLTGLES